MFQYPVGASNNLKIGVFSAMQHLLTGRFPSACKALSKSKPVKAAGTEAKSLSDFYQTEDDIFRLTTWLKVKEDGHSDRDARKKVRKSVIGYNINARNILGLPGSYASISVAGAAKGRTDILGRDQSVAQRVASSFRVKLASYPKDTLRRNITATARFQDSEITRQIGGLKRQLETRRISRAEFDSKAGGLVEKR